MVKAEADRDYYADLELKPTADANEIKRQFKKLALKYHPDRNPGHELEFNSKFQAIQSANEVLTDPQQRAKYDAQRIRAGLLHTYDDASPAPPKPSMPTRFPMNNFPPPPKPPPASAFKSTWAPPPSGAQKYARFNRPEPTSTWAHSPADDAKSKTNDYKAWEQMRHGQGPIPSRSNVPPKAARSSTFQPGREPNGAPPKSVPPRRSNWDRFGESSPGMPGISRANTSRVSPKRTGFAPSTPGGDEPQARSAYFTVSRSDRPSTSRSHTHMPPPPNPAPTAKKPDIPPRGFRDQPNLQEPSGNKPQGTNVSPASGLRRSATSATPRDSNSRNGYYNGKAANPSVAHVRAASASSDHNTANFSETKNMKIPGIYSSSSSSSSDSDEGEAARASARPYMIPKTRDARKTSSRLRQNGFNLYARAEDAGDEKMAPRVNLGDGHRASLRRHSAIDLDPTKPEISQERTRQDSQQGTTGGRGLQNSQLLDGSQPPLSRSKSWQEDQRKWEDRIKTGKSGPGVQESHPAKNGQNDHSPMYDSPRYTPFLSTPPPNTLLSDRWLDAWSFQNSKQPRMASAERPLHWAVPSRLPTLQFTPPQKRRKTQTPTLLDSAILNASVASANCDPLNSFNIPNYGTKDSTSSPLHSQSTEHIDTNFSPVGWHGKFFEPPPNRTATPLRAGSPTSGTTSQSLQEGPQWSSSRSRNVEDQASPPPPPPAQGKYSEEHWAEHFNNLRFDMPHPPQGRSPTKASTRKRPRTRVSKPVNSQATVEDAQDEPNVTSTRTNTNESIDSSRTGSDVDPMDLDDPIPPSSSADTGRHNKRGKSPSTPRQGPSLPPRPNAFGRPQANKLHLNLDNLAKVYPFAPSNEGLENMNDMTTNLPFESKASPTRPYADAPSQRLELPKPPRCPDHPTQLTKASCDGYAAKAKRYMEAWNTFNEHMAIVLASNQAFSQKTSNCDWLDIRSDSYDNYMQSLEELKRARVHWDTACEHHEKAMRSLGMIREEMRRGRGKSFSQ